MLTNNSLLFKISKRLLPLFAVVVLFGLIFIPLLSLANAAEAPTVSNHPYLAVEQEFHTIGDLLPQIQCTSGATATIYTEGLSSPDGLAFGTDNMLYVAEEGTGRVLKIASNGLTTTVLSDIKSPEGIDFDKSGNLYVVEDVSDGRVIKRDPSGMTETVSTGRDSPEGVVWVDDGSKGILYITEQNLEAALAVSSTTPSDYRTHITKVNLNTSMTTRIFNKLATFSFSPPNINATFWSYSGITVGSDGNLYVVNELAGKTTSGKFSGQNLTATGGGSLFRVNPASPSDVELTKAITTPEGLRFSTGITFPLYVASEDVGMGQGVLSTVKADGSTSQYCTGFKNIEDVIVDSDGTIYVTEDTNGWVIAIHPKKFPVWLPLIIRS